MLPELEIGDIVAGSVMGAYTAASASEFNSIPRTKLLTLNQPSPFESVEGTAPDVRNVTQSSTMNSR